MIVATDEIADWFERFRVSLVIEKNRHVTKKEAYDEFVHRYPLENRKRKELEFPKFK